MKQRSIERWECTRLYTRTAWRSPNGDHFAFRFEAKGREPSGFVEEFEFPHRTACAVPLQVIETGLAPNPSQKNPAVHTIGGQGVENAETRHAEWT